MATDPIQVDGAPAAPGVAAEAQAASLVAPGPAGRAGPRIGSVPRPHRDPAMPRRGF